MKTKTNVKMQKNTSIIKLGILILLVCVVLLCSILASVSGGGERNVVKHVETTSPGATSVAVTDTTIKFDPANYGYKWGKVRFTRTAADSAANPATFYVNGTGVSLSKGSSTGYYDCLYKDGLGGSKPYSIAAFATREAPIYFEDFSKAYSNVTVSGSVTSFDVGIVMYGDKTYTILSPSQDPSKDPDSVEYTKIVVQSNGVARIDFKVWFDKKMITTTKYLTPTGFENAAANAVVAKNFASIPEAKSLTYDGTEQVAYANGTNYTVGGITSGTNADRYSTTFTLNDKCYWTDGTIAPKTVEWKINPKTINLSNVKLGEIAIDSYNSFMGIIPPTNVIATIDGLMDTDTLDINAVWDAEPLANGKRNIVLSSSNTNYAIANSEIPTDYYADYYYVGNSKIEENCRSLTNENLAGLSDGESITVVGNPKVTEGMAIDKSITIRGENEDSGFDVSLANIEIGALVTVDGTFKLFNAPAGGGITLSDGGKLDITAYDGAILNVKADSIIPLGSVLVSGDLAKIKLIVDATDGEIRFGYEKTPGEVSLGGLKINGTSVSNDGKITIEGQIVGDTTNLKVIIADFDGSNGKDVTTSTIFNDDGSFAVNSEELFNSGKKIVTLTYTVGDYKLTASTLVTIPLRDGVNLNGQIDFGDLDGDSISYKDKDGVVHNLPVSDGKVTLPDDIVVDANGNVIISITDKTTGKVTDVTINVGGDRLDITNNFDKSDIVVRDTTLTVKTEQGFEYCVEDMDGNIIVGCDWTTGNNGEISFVVSANTEYVVKARAQGSENQQPGTSNIVNVTTKSEAVQAAQDDAKTALDEAARAVKDEIDNFDLPQAEKDELKTAIDNSVTQSKIDIESKNTVDTVKKAQEDAIAEFAQIIEDAKLLSDAKDAANALIDAKEQASNSNIDNMTDLSDKDKENYKNAVADAVKTAKENIANAKIIADVETAKKNGNDAIAVIVEEATTLNSDKAEAIIAINAKFEEAKNKINNFNAVGIDGSAITQEAKDAVIALLKNEQDATITAMKGCENSADVKIALEDGLLKIAQCEAIGEIGFSQEYWNGKLQDLVDGENKKLTQDEADEFINANNNWYTESIAKIMESAEISGLADIAKIANNEMYKESVIASILCEKNLALAEANKLDDSNPKKVEIINGIDNAYSVAQENVKAIDAKDFNNVQSNVERVSNEEMLSINKLQAKAEIELSTQEALKRAEMLKEPFLSQEKDKINVAYSTAINAVNNAIQADSFGSSHTPKNIAFIHKMTIDNLGFNAHLLATKNDAIARIEDYSSADNAAAVTAAKAEIVKEYDKSLNAINSATDRESGKLAMEEGEIAINNAVYTFVVANAVDVVGKIEADANAILDELTNLTAEEKLDIKNAIDEAVQTAKDAIATAETLDGVDIAEKALKDAIAETVLGAQKDDANNALETIADFEKAELDKLTGLTAKDIADAKAMIDDVLADAKIAIDGKDDASDIITAKNDAESAIQQVTTDGATLSVAKTDAKNDLDSFATAEQEKIDALNNLSDAEKAEAKSAIDEAVTAGKVAIDESSTVVNVNTQNDATLDIIKNVTTDAVKKVAGDYAEEVKAAINNSNLDSAEKQSAISAIDALISNDIDGINKAIDEAVDSSELNQAVADGMEKILSEYQAVVAKEFDDFAKDYTVGGEYIDDYDNDGKVAIADAIQNGEMLIGNATSIDELQDALESAKNSVVDLKTKAPIATVDFVNEKLSGLEPNREYTINDGTNAYVVTADSDGNIALSGKDSSGNGYDCSGKTIEVTKNGIIGVQAESNPQQVEVPARAVTPAPVIDYMDRTVDLGKSNAKFTVTVDGDEITVTTDNNGEIVLEDAWIGKTVSFAEVTDGENSLGSLPNVITIEKYWTLTFDYNDAGVTADKRYTVNDGQTVPIQADPTRSGYIFLGWFKDSACTIEWNFKYGKVNGNTSIYAGWQAEHSGVNTVTVIFVAEGQPSETITIDKNTIIKAPSVNSPDGKVFAGWYTDSDFTYKYDFKSKVTENITLYAKFVTSKIVVTLPDGKESELNYGDKIDRPTDPTNEGYTFAGWYTDKECNNALLFAGDKSKDGITQSITLYPKWVQERHTVTGVVTDEDGNPVANTDITIEIQPGGKTITTDSQGRFTVDVPDGNYRIVVKYEKDSIITIVTEAICVDGDDVSISNISIMGANLNSKVEIGENAPDVVVSGLNDLFGSDKYVSDAEKQKAKLSGNKAELKFVVSDSGKTKVLNDFATGNKKQIGAYLDFSLYKIMTINGDVSTSYISSLDNILKVIIPLSADMQGKTNYVIYRIHDGEVQEINMGMANANANGEYMELSGDGKNLTVYTKNFSSYAIAFDEEVPVVEGSCYIHWILLALILAFLILTILFAVFFKKNYLANIITWSIYVVSLFVLAFFVWSCPVDIALWIAGEVLAIVAALIFLLVIKKKEKQQVAQEENETYKS